MKRIILYQLVFLTVCMVVPMLAHAQPPPVDDTPIDGGLSLLLAAGVGYGVKKYRDRKKEHAAEEKI